jgi:hypothetical protein
MQQLMLYRARSQATRRAEVKVYPFACGMVAHLRSTAVKKFRFVTFVVNHIETKKIVQVRVYPLIPEFWKSPAFWEASRLRLFCPGKSNM